ncbi:hypothetical protein GNI_007390 [Gregarina niphandrodes]|uniref:Uncharacterized protein n=1 Tax=Gregarina niphandrodes TaxID=110365 RepID=A0A023BD64_GRENI|nr:hypothetical protein GNI_007390 [Gregarina niphandrodes]EZG87283.1 hypothetical protein GNI_007390 [Gregarina niphandrodes]|eukprot:XP_011128679.1 hypothetical protein GNI_007390 [Gregarina niphandrodes]
MSEPEVPTAPEKPKPVGNRGSGSQKAGSAEEVAPWESVVKFPAIPRCPLTTWLGDAFWDPLRQKCIHLNRANQTLPHTAPCPPGSGRRDDELTCRGRIETGFQIKCKHAWDVVPAKPYYANEDYQCIQVLVYDAMRQFRCPKGFQLKKLYDRTGYRIEWFKYTCVQKMSIPAHVVTFDPLIISNCVYVSGAPKLKDHDLDQISDEEVLDDYDDDLASSTAFTPRMRSEQGAEGFESDPTTSAPWSADGSSVDRSGNASGSGASGSNASEPSLGRKSLQPKGMEEDRFIDGSERRAADRSPYYRYLHNNTYAPLDQYNFYGDPYGRIDRDGHVQTYGTGQLAGGQPPRRSQIPGAQGRGGQSRGRGGECTVTKTQQLVLCDYGDRLMWNDEREQWDCVGKRWVKPDPDPSGCKKGHYWSNEFMGCIQMRAYSPPRMCPDGVEGHVWEREGGARRYSRGPRYRDVAASYPPEASATNLTALNDPSLTTTRAPATTPARRAPNPPPSSPTAWQNQDTQPSTGGQARHRRTQRRSEGAPGIGIDSEAADGSDPEELQSPGAGSGPGRFGFDPGLGLPPRRAGGGEDDSGSGLRRVELSPSVLLDSGRGGRRGRETGYSVEDFAGTGFDPFRLEEVRFAHGVAANNRCYIDSALADTSYCPHGYWLEQYHRDPAPLCIQELVSEPLWDCRGMGDTWGLEAELVHEHGETVCLLRWDARQAVSVPEALTKRQKKNALALASKSGMNLAQYDQTADTMDMWLLGKDIHNSGKESWDAAIRAALQLLNPHDTFSPYTAPLTQGGFEVAGLSGPQGAI